MANELGIPPTKPDKEYPGIPKISRDLDADALITLGKARVSPINMANTYATFANGGVRANVHVIKKVTDLTGEDPYIYKVANKDVLDPDIDADVSYAMQQVVQEGTGQAALALGRPAAGKTGTATNDKDQVSSAWFIGYTPQLATAVMYVRGDGDDQLDGWLPSYFGADYPARTWTAIMQQESEGMEVEEFPPPANVDGEAPTEGHEPEPTPAPTTQRPTKKPSPTKEPTTEPPTSRADRREPTDRADEEPDGDPDGGADADRHADDDNATADDHGGPVADPQDPTTAPPPSQQPTTAGATAPAQPTPSPTPRNSSWFLFFW